MLARRTSRRLITASVTAAVLALGGCTGSDDDPKSASGSGPSVIAPGKPGEAAETLSAEQAAEQRDDDTPNSADLAYARMMIKHHGQALEMTELVPDRAESGRVKRLAERIAAAQGPEIDTMKAWLKNHGGDAKGDRHDHAAMPGMAGAAQMKELRAAEGKDFDELFLKLMITHHDGAITMAVDALSEGNNIQIGEMADDVIAQQTTEISRMRDMS
ncbi:DUF305 domain-containing protein [Streptomyces fructofermentans]|uniref:Lipoprotein n=1 Tax=Streptomyces fructofermentans TaxID=152141 RepID=A0A918U611_9ACTN|nr:DUF305 domain-containing protein [Streptomyces fructofermentans]GGX95891.1 lipoprotein [Streptomyces fructofermentans]